MLTLMLAVQAYQTGDYNRALSLFQDVLTEQPDNATAHAQLAVCLMRMDRPFAAIQQTERALKADPELPLAHVAKAIVANALDDVAGAEAAVAEALRLDPGSTDALSMRCAIALGERDSAAARQAAEALLQLDPSSRDAHYFLSRAASMQRDHATAERHAREALRLEPNSDSAHEAIGWAFWAGRDYDRAREAGLSALAIDPNSQNAQVLLAAVEMQRKPVTGWIHRAGMIFSMFSIKQFALYVAPGLFLYMVAQDLLLFWGMPDVARWMRYAFLALFLAMFISIQQFTNRARENQKEARLKRSY